MTHKPAFRFKLAISVIAVIVFLGWIGQAQTQAASANPLQGLREYLAGAVDIQERHHKSLRTIPNVVGTAVGVSEDGKPVIKVYTKSPGVMAIPTSLDGLRVDVEETGEFHALAGQFGGQFSSDKVRRRVNPATLFTRPVPIGVSTGNGGECSAGTIGARVKDANGNVFALSNNHVYALENAAVPPSAVLQPGLYDTNCTFNPANVIGTLSTLSSFVPIVFSTSANNTVDAAIAASDVSLLGRSTPSNGYGTPRSATVSAFVGQRVKKYGRTTSQTSGQVLGINAIVMVGYGSGTAQFVDQIVVGSSRAFILPGDSGSLLVTAQSNNPVGLLFAGNGNGKIAIANRIDAVLNAFSVTIDGN
jgi:hypothetical protein